MPADRMLNAIQQRMVEESLVEKEMYDSMLKIRAQIEEQVGSASILFTKKDDDGFADVDSVASGRSASGQPLPDLPEGDPEALRRLGVPVRERKGTVTPPRSAKNRVSSAAQPEDDSGVPADVLAIADPLRDANRRVAPYVPTSKPSGNTSDPFPQLGSMGRPLG